MAAAEAEMGDRYMPMTYYPGAREPEDMPPAPQGPDENRQAAAAFRRSIRLCALTGQANSESEKKIEIRPNYRVPGVIRTPDLLVRR
jgi:hypothetical protein